MQANEIDSFTKEKLIEGQDILIYGAGRYGKLAYWGLRSLDLPVTYFIDEYHVGEVILGVPVIAPSEIEKHKDDVILLASYNYYADMYYRAKYFGAKKIFNILTLLKLDYDVSVLSEYLLDEKNNYTKYKNVVEHMLDDKLVINHCEIVVTECCSLRCKDCANLMQYYSKPEHIDADEIINFFDNFLDTIDCLLDLRLLGGEPFVYPDLKRILDKYSNDDRIKRITIYTNSTILPAASLIKSLQNKKVVVHMSNYGKISRNVQKLDDTFNEYGIEHYIHSYVKWKDIGKVYKRNYNVSTLTTLYQTCSMGKCYSFYRGKLYLCPRAAHGERLHFFENLSSEVVDFSTLFDKSAKRNELISLIQGTKFISACDYCNGSGKMADEIEAAVQVSERRNEK